MTCYPLTLIDAYRRFLLRCEALRDPDTRHVRAVLDSAFQELGTPHAICSDNGPPFASTGAGGSPSYRCVATAGHDAWTDSSDF